MSGASHEIQHNSNNKKIALLIAVLALFLAISETISKSYQTEVLILQMKSSDLWAFYQSKNIRQSSMKNSKDIVNIIGKNDDKTKEAIQRWDKDIVRYDSEPATGDGKAELMEKAKQAEHERDVVLKKYHRLEIASGLLQVAIVIASASVVTGVAILFWCSGGLGIISLFFITFGIFFS
jgi:Domain of unknown function (DUF4337)